jgi:hypothetical protein
VGGETASHENHLRGIVPRILLVFKFLFKRFQKSYALLQSFYVVHDAVTIVTGTAHPATERSGLVTMVKMESRSWVAATLTKTVERLGRTVFFSRWRQITKYIRPPLANRNPDCSYGLPPIPFCVPLALQELDALSPFDALSPTQPLTLAPPSSLMPENLHQLLFVATARQLFVEPFEASSLMLASTSGVSCVSGAVPPAFDNETEALWPR